MIVDHNCICIKSIVIFSFMKLAIWHGLCKKFKFQLRPKSFFSTIYYFNIFYEDAYSFCSCEYTLVVFIKLFPFRPWPILIIKPLMVITCFHVYCLFIYNIVVLWPFQHKLGKQLKILIT
jgi:hypothetical protein